MTDNNDGLLRSKPYSSELEPQYINLVHVGKVRDINNKFIYYEVHGVVYSIATNSRLPFKKQFSKFADAKQYFDDIIKHHPLSTIIIQKRIVEDIIQYA